MAEQMTMEQQAAAIDATDTGAQGSEPQSGAQSAAQQSQPANFDPAEFRQFMAEYRQHQNQINSQLGNFSKKQSELDKFLAKQNQPQSPAEWSKLDDLTRKQTRAIVKAAFEEEFGDDMKNWNGVHQSFQAQEQNNRIMGIANQALGEDYGKYDKILGSLYLSVKQGAEAGDPNAERFLKEIRETESGVYRLVEMAKAQASQSLQAQSQQAAQQREGRAQRTSTAVGGNRQAQSGTGADGLPTDKAERRKAIAAQIDEFNQRQG